MGGKHRKSRYESSSSSDSETSDSSSSDTSDSDLDTSHKHKSHHKTGRSRHKKHRKHKKDRRSRSSSSDSSVSLNRKHRKHKHHSSKHHKKHKHSKHPKHEQCKADNGIYNRDRESGIRYDLGRQDLYSTNDRDQYRYNMDGYWDRDARNSYDQDICRDYCRSERDQSRREKYYGYHQEASSSESQYYAHSRYLTQSESYRHSQMTSHEQRQNEYEYKHYPVTQQRDNHSHSRYYSQQDNCRHLVSRPFSYSQTAGSQPTAYFHTKPICDKSLLTADSLEQTQSTTDSFNQSRVYHSNQIIDMTTSQLGGSSQSDGSWSSASFHYQIGQGGSLQPDGSQSSANVHSQIASSQSTAQFHNHADSSQQEARPFIQLTNDAFIPIDHSLSPSELRTLKDKLLNAEQGLLDAKNKYFNNLTECERKFKERENEITKQYQYAQRELLQARERVKMKYNMVSPTPESNSENTGSMQSSSVESLNYHIPKTSGSMVTASHQINNQEPKIENECHQMQSEQEDPCQKIESGLEDLCPQKLITENKNVIDIQVDEHLNPYTNIKHSDSVMQEDSVKEATLVCSKNDSKHEKSFTQKEIVTGDCSDNPCDLSSSFIGQLLKGSPVSSCFCDLSSTFMARLVRTDQLQSTSETDFDASFRSNSDEYQLISTPKHDQAPHFETYQIVLSTTSPRPISEILKEASSRQKKKTQRAKDLPNIEINSSQCETFDSSVYQQSTISKDSKSKLSTVHFSPMPSEEISKSSDQIQPPVIEHEPSLSFNLSFEDSIWSANETSTAKLN